MKHKITSLEGPYLQAAFLQTAFPSWRVELRKVDDVVKCYTTQPVGHPSNNTYEFGPAPALNWFLFGSVYERHHDLINAQMVNWCGSTWHLQPQSVLTFMARAYIKAVLNQYHVTYDVELPDIT